MQCLMTALNVSDSKLTTSFPDLALRPQLMACSFSQSLALGKYESPLVSICSLSFQLGLSDSVHSIPGMFSNALLSLFVAVAISPISSTLAYYITVLTNNEWEL